MNHVVVQLRSRGYIVPPVLQLSRGGNRQSLRVFQKNNSVSVDCLVQLMLGVAVGGIEVVGAVVVFSMSVAGEASSRRRCRLGPIRALRVCMASDVSLPLVRIGGVLSEWLFCSSVSASFCWTALVDALRVAVFGSSVRCRIMWFLQRAKAC